MTISEFTTKWAKGWKVDGWNALSRGNREVMEADLEEMLKAHVKKGAELMAEKAKDSDIYRLGYEINEIMERWAEEDKRMLGKGS